MPHSGTWQRLALGAWLLLGAACAISISEGRSARVLRGGEVQIAEVNNIVVPTAAVKGVIGSAETLADAVDDDRALTEDEKHDLVAGATAIALSSPGYGAHLDVAVGFGYRLDGQLRLGNGVYGASLRRGLDLGKWHGALGLRAAYNSGGSLVPYLDTVNSLLKVGDMTRWDGQLFGQVGREFGEWGKLWLGAKWMESWFAGTVDASSPKIGLGKDSFDGRLRYLGGFVGVGLGYRWFHVLLELTVMHVDASELTLFGRSPDLDGWLIAPSWGFQGTF